MSDVNTDEKLRHGWVSHVGYTATCPKCRRVSVYSVQREKLIRVHECRHCGEKFIIDDEFTIEEKDA